MSVPAWIVTVSPPPRPGARGRIDLGDLQAERNYSGQRAYSPVQAGRCDAHLRTGQPPGGTEITATVLHPGVVHTHFGAEDQAHFAILIRMAGPFMKTAAQGAITPVYLASSPQVEGVTGRYFANRKPKTGARSAYDTAAAARLCRPAPTKPA